MSQLLADLLTQLSAQKSSSMLLSGEESDPMVDRYLDSNPSQEGSMIIEVPPRPLMYVLTALYRKWDIRRSSVMFYRPL